MIENFFQAFINIIIDVLQTFSNIVVNPLLNAVFGLWPNLASYMATVESFFLRLLNGVNFAKELFLNITGFPRVLFYAMVVYFFARLSLNFSLRGLKFAIRMYYFVRGHHLADVSK